MALYHKWDVKNGFSYVLQFFSLISDGLGCVPSISTALFRDGGKTENLGGLEVICRLIFDGTGFDSKSDKIWGGQWPPYPMVPPALNLCRWHERPQCKLVRFLNLKAICTYEKSKENQPSHDEKNGNMHFLSIYIL